ncbi:MAG TPA: SRPBCC family protein [Polyangiaceae bacterium]
MLKKILIGVAALIGVLAIVIATRPSTFHVERSITIQAPPSAAFAHVDDFHAWRAWSPWEKLDPTMQRTHAGAASGAGAQYAWQGNDEVGEGRMTIEKSEAPSLISIKLEFIKPFEATNTATFAFNPAPEGTKVTWGMDGQLNFVAKAAHLFMDMDSMVGKDFERGLAALKAVTESSAQSAKPTANTAQ